MFYTKFPKVYCSLKQMNLFYPTVLSLILIFNWLKWAEHCFMLAFYLYTLFILPYCNTLENLPEKAQLKEICQCLDMLASKSV